VTTSHLVWPNEFGHQFPCPTFGQGKVLSRQVYLVALGYLILRPPSPVGLTRLNDATLDDGVVRHLQITNGLVQESFDSWFRLIGGTDSADECG